MEIIIKNGHQTRMDLNDKSSAAGVGIFLKKWSAWPGNRSRLSSYEEQKIGDPTYLIE